MSAITYLAYILTTLVLAILSRNFWRLRRALQFAETYDVDINQGRYESLPIYAYIRHHVHIVLLANIALLIISIVLAIRSIAQAAPFLGIVSTLLTVLLAVHTAFIACYESTNPGIRIVDENIQSYLRYFRRLLWVNALMLFATVVLMMMSRAVLLVFSS